MSTDSLQPSEPPKKLSPSRAKDFVQCPQLYWFKTVHGCSTPPTEATIKGTMFHSVLERFFDLENPEDRTLEAALSFVAPAWDTMVMPLRSRDELDPSSPEARYREAAGLWLDAYEGRDRARESLEKKATEYAAFLELEEEARALKSNAEVDLRAVLIHETSKIVTNYFVTGIEDVEKLKSYQPKGRELYLNEEVDGVPLHGFIDRLDHFVKADGSERWIISDYKTGKLPNPRFGDDPFFAMWVYALLLRAAQGVTPDAVRLLYVNAPSKEAGDLREVVTEEKLAQTSQTMRRIWSEITISHAEDRWETKKSRLCDWCYFKERGCPGHGGNREDAPLDWMDAAFAEG